MRAYLIVPAGSDAEGAVALCGAAEALVFDPRDIGALSALRTRPERPRLLARVGAIEEAAFDSRLDAVAAACLDAVVLTAAGAREVADLGSRLAVWEAEHGLPDGGLGIVALVAGAAGVLAADGFAEASPRLCGLGWDAGVLRAELGAEAAWAGGGWIPPLAQARALVRLAAAAAGVPAIEAAYPGNDAPGCREATAAARRDGFAAMLARDPVQAASIRAGA